jgi:hypothetical protein
MLKRFIYAFSAVAFVALSSTGSTSCAGGTGSGAGGGSGGGTGGAGGGAADPELTCDATPPATSFAKVYMDIISPSCLQGCHVAGAVDGSDSYGLYNTETAAYGQVNKKSLYAGTDMTLKVVDPMKSLGTSTMWLKVLGRAKSPTMKNLGGQMPLGRTALTTVQKQLLKDWICSGAAM